MTEPLLRFTQIFFGFWELLIIARIILSWVRAPIPYQIGKFLMDTTEPLLGTFRKIIPPIGMFDLSPIVALFALEYAQVFLVWVLT